MHGSCEIQISDLDRLLAEDDVRRRELPKREFGVPTHKVDESRSDYKIDYLGVLAEMAVGKMLGVPHNTHERLCGDDGYDMTWCGKRCEVKFTFYAKGHLLVKRKEDVVADLFILVTGNDRSMHLLGWTDRKTFLRLGEVKDFGYGAVYALNQTKLKSMDAFDPVQKKLLDMISETGGERNGKGIESAEAV